MAKNKTLHLPKKNHPLPEHAVQTVKENMARPLTTAEAHARRSRMAIALAEAEAKKNEK